MLPDTLRRLNQSVDDLRAFVVRNRERKLAIARASPHIDLTIVHRRAPAWLQDTNEAALTGSKQLDAAKAALAPYPAASEADAAEEEI